MRTHYFSVAFFMALAEIRAEVTGQWFGILWWVLEPILYVGAFYVIFAVLGLRGGEDAAPFLLVALVPWKWFATSIATGSVALKRVTGLIQQVYVPKYVFVLATVLTNLVRFLIVLTLLLLFLLGYGYQPSVEWIGLLPVILVQGFLIFGVAGIFAALVPFALDLRIVINNGLMLMFFLSGVFFDISRAPESLLSYLYLNPMVILIESYRDVLLHGIWPAWSGLFLNGSIALLLSVIACYLLHRFDRVYPKVL